MSPVSRLNGYLIDGPQYAVPARSKPPEGRLKMHKGSQPTDGARRRKPGGGYYPLTSNLILDKTGRDELLAREPQAEKWLRPYVGGDELISGDWRWCLWLKDANPAELRASAAIQERLKRVRDARLESPTESVRAFAKYPTLFTQDRQPDEVYLGLPEVSSETREYIPMAILPPEVGEPQMERGLFRGEERAGLARRARPSGGVVDHGASSCAAAPERAAAGPDWPLRPVFGRVEFAAGQKRPPRLRGYCERHRNAGS